MNYRFIKKKAATTLDELEKKRLEEINEKIKTNYYKKPEITKSIPEETQEPQNQMEAIKENQEKEKIKKNLTTPTKNILNASEILSKSIIDLKKILIDLDKNKEYEKDINEFINRLKVLNKKIRLVSETLNKFRNNL